MPLALLLSATPLGLNGIWWALCISTILKGTVIAVWYALYVHRRKIYQQEGLVHSTLSNQQADNGRKDGDSVHETDGVWAGSAMQAGDALQQGDTGQEGNLIQEGSTLQQGDDGQNNNII